MTVLPVIPSRAVGDDWLAQDWIDYVQGAFAWLDANRPVVELTQTVAQSLPNNAFAAVTFTAETLDRRGQHSTTTNTSRVIATADLGTYFVIGRACFAGSTVGSRRAKLVESGVTDLQGGYGIYSNTTSFGTAIAAALWRPASSTAYLELQAFQDSGGALNSAVSGAFVSALTLWRLGS